MSVRLKACVHVIPVPWWICWISLLHSQHVSAPSVGQTNMDGNKLSSSTFYSEVHFEYHMTGESRPSSSFFKFFSRFQLIFKIFEVFHPSSLKIPNPNVQLEWFLIRSGQFGRVTGGRPGQLQLLEQDFCIRGSLLMRSRIYTWTNYQNITKLSADQIVPGTLIYLACQ